MSTTTTITQTTIGLPAPLEKHEVSLSFEPIQTEPPAGRTAYAAAANGDASPSEDEGNIYYVNAIPDIPEAKDLLRQRQADTELASSFWSAKATEAADLKTSQGKLPQPTDGDASIKRSNYRIQVIEHAVQHSGWMSQVASQNASKKFTCAKDQLHDELLKTVLSGLLLPPNVYSNFERILQSIGRSLEATKTHSASQNKWVLLTTYRYDSVQRRIFAGIRTIYFSVDQKLVDYNRSKHDKGTDADLELQFKMDDYAFNESVWVGLKPKVQAFVDDKGVLVDVIDIPVGP